MFGISWTYGILALTGVLLVAPLGATAAPAPDPEAFLGYAPGDRFTPHHRVVDYMEELASVSPRVRLETYGVTPGGRPLLLLTIATPERLADLEELQSAYRQLADPRRTSENKARDLVRDLPVAVWLSFGIHGNESSSTEAALSVAHTLASSEDPEVLEWLDNTVVLIDPCLNPDGRDRYVSWYNDAANPDPDPWAYSREHREPWPGGRYNHFLFDLNRDWAWLSQPESRARARAYLAWRPQVHADLHEMWYNSTYFFFPPERPVHALYPPSVLTWSRIFGRGNAAAFDEKGWRYYTSEDFDLFYPGYGDSWPTFQGAIGMTYEQAGHGRAGRVVTREDGTVLTLTERVEHHATAALATVATAAANREAKLLDYHRFFQIPGRLPVAAYVFPPGQDPGRTAELVDLLMANGAEVHRTTKAQPARGLVDYRGGTYRGSIPPDSYIVSLNQPLHRFLRAVLEPEPAIPDTMFYDVSAWSLPLAFGVEAYQSSSPIDDHLERLEEPPTPRGELENPEATYAYLLSSTHNATLKALGRLLRDDIRVHFTSKEITVDGRRYPSGSLVVFRSGNPGGLPAMLEQHAREFGARIVGVNSGLTDKGPDLGSNQVRRLKPFRVGLAAGEPVIPTSMGACWFLLDQHYGFPYSVVLVKDITRRMLDELDVLVFPDDGAQGYGYSSALDSSQVEEIREWVGRGGVFVGLGGGGFFATEDRGGLGTVSIADPDADLSDEDKDARNRARRLETLEEREKRRWLEHLPGTIFKVRVDSEHPVGYGYQGDTQVLVLDEDALELGPPGTNVAVFPESPRLSGYADPEHEAHLAETPYLVAERMGRGHVVLYAADPNFRLFWYGLNRLFLNSLCFLPSL